MYVRGAVELDSNFFVVVQEGERHFDTVLFGKEGIVPDHSVG